MTTSGTATVNTDVNGLVSTGSTGTLTVNEDNGLAIQAQGALTNLTVNGSKSATAGDIFVFGSTASVANIAINNEKTGNIVVSNDLEATTTVALNTTAGSGSINGVGTVIAPTISLLAGTGSVDSVVNGTAGADTAVTANSNGGDVKLSYIGSNSLILNASSGNNNFTAGTTNSAADIQINGNLAGAGTLDLTTNVLNFNGAFTLTFNDANVQSLAGSGLTLNGAGGTFITSAAGPGVTLTATDGSFVANGLTNFNGGDLTVTLANNNGINSFTVNQVGGLNGDNTNELTINAAVVTGNSLANSTNFANINLLGNTIYNSVGDVFLPSNLIFTGQDLAVIAAGNVTSTGATIINLSSTTGDGGSLTILAGYATTPNVATTTTTGGPVTVIGFSGIGGNVNLAGVTLNTSSSAAGGGDAGTVFISANGVSPTTGNVTVGPIIATAVNGSGGLVAVGGSSGTTVGDVTTTGSAGGGDVLLGVGTVNIVGTPVFTSGSLSGGSFVPAGLSAGDLAYGTVNAGTGDIALAGALNAGNTIGGTAIIGDNLEVFMGAGNATINTQVNEVQADATFAATSGSLTVNETGSINVDHIDGNDLSLQVNASGDVNLIGNLSVGANGTVGIQSTNLTTLAAAKIVADSLNLNVTGVGTVNTNVDTLTTTTGTGSLTVNEDDGIDLGSQAALADLTVVAGKSAAGDITNSSAFTVGNLDLSNTNGNITLNNNVTGTNSITLNTTGGTGNISGTGTLISPNTTLIADSGNITSIVNGVGGASSFVTAQAALGGDVSLTYLGTGSILLGASSGNGDYTVAGSAVNGGDVAINGDIDGTGSLNVTTDTLSFNGNYTLDFDDIAVQSFAGGSGLTINGVAGAGNKGTFTTTDGGAGTTFTATDGNLTFNNNTQYNGGDVFATLAVNNGINSYTNNGNLNGDTLNNLTITAAIVAGGGTTTNFANVFILQGNTIVNNGGDVTLPANLIFQGQSLAIIASGNVTTTGATLIDLSSTTGDGGDLTVLAGFNSTGTPAGNIITQTANPVTVTGISSTGGNINLSGVTINTSSTVGSAGDVLLLAQSPGNVAVNAGTVVVGNINATGAVNGGLVVVGGYRGVTTGNINTVGTTGTDGSVILGAGDVAITGTPVYTNGALSGGSFVPGELETGNVTYGTINAGTGDVTLAGALTAGDSIVGGTITADHLTYVIGAGTAVSAVGSNSNRLSVDATTAGGGSVTVNEADNVIIDDVTGSNVNLTVNANTVSGDIDIAGDIAVGTGTVIFNGNDVTQSTGTLAANSLGLQLTGNAALTTSITNLLDSSVANLTLNNTGALTVNDLAATGFADIFNTGNLTVAAGSVITGVDRLTFQTVGSNPGNILIGENANIQTAGALKSGNGEGDVLILQGVAPTRTRNLRGKNLVVTTNGTGTVLTGRGKGTKKVVGLNPNNAKNNLTGTNAMLLVKAQTRNGVVFGGGTTVVADPPPMAGTLTTTTLAAPVSHTDGSAQSSGMTEALLNAPSALSSINTVPTLTSSSSINLNAIDNTISNLATVNANLSGLNQMEDDSYMVTYAPMGQIVDGNVCSDMDFGFVAGAKTVVETQ